MIEDSGPRDLASWWGSDLWRADVEAWIGEQARGVGRVLVGPVEVHSLRFWAVVLRVPTDRGIWWFKENAPSQAFEAALVAELADVVPGSVPPVVAVDTARGWLLTADLGHPLAEDLALADPAPADPAVAAGALAELAGAYAVLQRRLERRPAAMRAAGVPFFHDGNAMAYAVALADHLASLPEGDEGRLDVQERRAVDAGLARLGEAAARLEASGIPDSLQHNDLHWGNAFRTAGGMALIDWGDAVWAHPLATLRVPLWLAHSRLGYPPGSLEHDRIIDAAIEPWTDLATPAQLRRLLPAAERVSCLHRAECWRRLIADVPSVVVPAEVRAAPRRWLLTALAEDPYLDAQRD